eukprot:NODE_294_length_11497_cov_0.618530.p3 type:complete len:230 gc:universal NODE_294_length_11497_cov_0.618530:3490-2801(-)
MWILTGNLLNSRSAQLNELQGTSKIDDIIKYIVDTNSSNLDVIGSVEQHFNKIERSDLDITLFLKVNKDTAIVRDSIEFFMKTMNLDRIDTAVLISTVGSLYTDAERDMTDFLDQYSFVESCPYIDSIGVFELSPSQLSVLKEQMAFRKENAKLPKYNYIQLEYCCVPPQHLVKYCISRDIEILSLDKFEIENFQSLGLKAVNCIMRYIMNIKSRSICTHQGYIVNATK